MLTQEFGNFFCNLRKRAENAHPHPRLSLSPYPPLCHVERSRVIGLPLGLSKTSPEISPCASLSRDDKGKDHKFCMTPRPIPVNFSI